MLVKAFCSECHRPVALRLESGNWMPGRCRLHPGEMRISGALRAKRGAQFFAEMRAEVNLAIAGVKGGAA